MSKKAYQYIVSVYENKLIELMGEKEYAKFAAQVAKEAFRKEIEGMVDGEFKDFCLEILTRSQGRLKNEELEN